MSEKQNNQPQSSSKAAIGVVCGLFLGLIGLLFMLCWPAGSYERETFLKGWLWTFFISLAIEIIIMIIYFVVFAGAVGGILGTIK